MTELASNTAPARARSGSLRPGRALSAPSPRSTVRRIRPAIPTLLLGSGFASLTAGLVLTVVDPTSLGRHLFLAAAIFLLGASGQLLQAPKRPRSSR